MAIVTINDENLTAIANSIRGKNGLTDTYTPSQMPAAIDAIETGGGGGGQVYQDLYFTASIDRSEQKNYAVFDTTNASTLRFTYDYNASTNSSLQLYCTATAYLGYKVQPRNTTNTPYLQTVAVDSGATSNNFLSRTGSSVKAVTIELDVSSYTTVSLNFSFAYKILGTEGHGSVLVYDIELV